MNTTNKDQMRQLEKVNIGLVTALGALPFIVGGVMWLTTISSKADQAISISQDADKKYSTIIQDLADIKAQLGIKNRIHKEDL